MIPKHIITTWICSPTDDKYTTQHRELFSKCLQSWLRLMPDYKITIVTLGNLRDHGTCPWLEARLEEGNFIGASQWARFRWLQMFGGIYCDMDVEAVRRFDPLLPLSYAIGHIGARTTSNFAINNAVMASVPEHEVLQAQLDRLLLADPSDPQYGNTSGPYLMSDILTERGWDGSNTTTTVGDITVFGSQVFYPFLWNEKFTPRCIKPETLAIHWWGQSWHPHAGLRHEGRGMQSRLRLRSIGR